MKHAESDMEKMAEEKVANKEKMDKLLTDHEAMQKEFLSLKTDRDDLFDRKK